MIPEIFVDGIGGIGFSGGMVRIDLVSLSPNEKDAEGKPEREVRQRLIMTPIGLIEVFTNMHKMLDKLVELGVLQRRPATGEIPQAPPEGKTEAPPDGNMQASAKKNKKDRNS